MPEAPREVHHSLPAAERVEHHRKAAKDLLRAARAGQADAVGRLQESIGELPAQLRLADAQRAIAREHGHSSWTAFRRDIERQAGEPGRSVARIGPVTPERYEEGAAKLLRELADGDTRSRRRFRAHVPRFAAVGDTALGERATIADARLVIARECGFPTWRRLVEGLRAESEGWRRGGQHPEPVAAALAAIRAGDPARLQRLLDADPELVRAEVGAGGSLLGEVAQPDVFGSSLGHDLGVDRACVDLLIERGSDLDGPLNLAACFDRLELVTILLAAGARVDARGIHGVTPLQTAIYHGSRASAGVLAAVGLVPDAPWIAAGAGRVDRLERFLDGHGGLTAEAYLHRPNPADIGWLHRLPARDVPQEVLDEALVHAAQNERPEAVAWLLEHGADPDAGPYQGCGALHLAAAFGAIECVRLLVAAGADIDRTNDFNGDNAIGWAGYVLEQERPGDAGVAAVREFLDSRGSRPAVWGA
ncbi:MAG TPA: ankyrin repeat domain-containing protein [Streptosporangiaceae bacterium]|nr:ankyrin repeat domain-containing protein [Streptosporangiaceae bacterium]